MIRGSALERGLVLVVDPLRHVLELRQDEPLFRWRPIQAVPGDPIEQIVCSVANHLQAVGGLPVPLGVLRFEVLVHFYPLILEPTSDELLERQVTTQALQQRKER